MGITTTCSRCGAEIVVMTAGEYLSSTDEDLDFMLHSGAAQSQLAIIDETRAYACPSCGKGARLAAGPAPPGGEGG